MAIVELEKIQELIGKIRTGEVKDETLSDALIDIHDTVIDKFSATEKLQKQAEEALSDLKTAKEANAQLLLKVVVPETDKGIKDPLNQEDEKPPLSWEDTIIKNENGGSY